MLPDVMELTQCFYYRRPDWTDGTSEFAAMVRKVLKPTSRVLDLGAGCGGMVSFRGEVAMVVGMDADYSINNNINVDRRVRGLAGSLPLRAAAFDLVCCDWVIEHLSDPRAAAREVMRVLAPGGFFVLRTGNLFYYSYALAAMTPYWFHRMVANLARGLAAEDDPHPTYYRLNTAGEMRRSLVEAGFAEVGLRMVEAEPSYLMFSVPSFLAGLAYERIVNRIACLARLRACIFVCARKPL
jgi:SAM-dependent methyltransferase